MQIFEPTVVVSCYSQVYMLQPLRIHIYNIGLSHSVTVAANKFTAISTC